jgi:hypothetical protein
MTVEEPDAVISLNKVKNAISNAAMRTRAYRAIGNDYSEGAYDAIKEIEKELSL